MGLITASAHGFSINDQVVFATDGALPDGIVAGTSYYVISLDFTVNQFRISSTLGGDQIEFTGTQSGTHTVKNASSGTSTWALGANASHTGSSGDMTYNTALSVSTVYTIIFTVTVCGTTGSVTPKIGTSFGVAVNSTGVHMQTITSPASDADLIFTGVNTVTIDDVYILKEADITASTDQTELASAYQHLMVLETVSEALVKDKRPEAATMLKTLVSNELEYLKKSIMQIVPDGLKSLKYS